MSELIMAFLYTVLTFVVAGDFVVACAYFEINIYDIIEILVCGLTLFILTMLYHIIIESNENKKHRRKKK